jgi:hypothetical protein
MSPEPSELDIETSPKIGKKILGYVDLKSSFNSTLVIGRDNNILVVASHVFLMLSRDLDTYVRQIVWL